MFTDEERAYFLARERKAHQARLDASGSPREPKDPRLAWAYALLGDDQPAPPAATIAAVSDPSDVSAPLPIARRIARRSTRILASPARVTLCFMGVGALLMLGIAIADALHLPGLRYPMFRSLNDLASWFPGDLIVAGLLVYSLAMAARWAAARLLRAV